MKNPARLILASGLLLWPVAAMAQSTMTQVCVNTTGTTTCTPVRTATPFPVTGTFTPSGTQAVNLTQVLGAAVSATNPIFVSPATASTPWIVTGSGTAGTAAAGVITIQGIASMTPVQVSQATAANLNAAIVGTGTAGTAATGVVTIQGIASGTVVPVSGTVTASNPVGITPTDRTLTSATGSSQTLMALNASRHGLVLQNTGNANCGVNPTGGTASIGGAGTLTLVPNGSYQPRIPTLSAITVICTAGQPFYAEEN